MSDHFLLPMNQLMSNVETKVDGEHTLTTTSLDISEPELSLVRLFYKPI
jgi:hypothetical protein